VNAKQIAEALGRNPSAEEAHSLILAIEARRTDLSARIAEISQRGGAIEDPPERNRAVLSGPDAVAKLDEEIKALARELDYLAQLSPRCFAAHESAVLSAARQAFPLARRRLPAAIERVRSAHAALDAAIVAANETVEALGQFENLGEEMPLDDDALAELLELRATLWAMRDLSVLFPPDQGYPRSFDLFYERRGNKDSPVIITRRRSGIHLPDFANSI
jgi:hypothetical protein